MSQPTHYLRVEGVNLSRFVFDTRELSTIRGGGLMMLDAVKTAREALETFAGAVETISEGASIGVFGFALPADKNERDAEAAVRSALDSRPTFVVDAIRANGEGAFRTDAEWLLARNRWRQMQNATLTAPVAVNDAPTNAPACEYDGVRPARKNDKNAGRKRDNADGTTVSTWLSEATAARSRRGREAKQDFYAAQLAKAELDPVNLDRDFANEFEQIAERSKGPLPGKLALFYADGNSFGTIQRELCTSTKKQGHWDRLIRIERAKFLRAFLDEELRPAQDAAWLFAPNDERLYRFETLMWGGDEVLFVLPAWQGWRFAERFFKATADWNTSMAGLDALPLTHTAALIFCQHHAPIHRIKDLAKEKMAESAKDIEDANGKKIGRGRNQLVYQVLESMDHLGTDYAAALQGRYHDEAKLGDLVLATDTTALHERLGAIQTAVANLRDADFPRNQLRSLVTKWIHHGAPTSFADALETFARTASETEAPLCELAKQLGDGQTLKRDENNKPILPPVLGDGLPLWLHLEELWDYAAP